ncbi:MAG: alpha/beta hydrolase [Erythrobacter sp.]
MQPKHASIAVNGIELSYFEWTPESVGENSYKPTLIFAHATGFHARVFDAIIERFAGHRVISIDLRGHGRSTGGPITHWRQVSDDVNALIGHLGISQAVGIGHSMGAHTLLQCTADSPDAFRQLVLFDPVILMPDYYNYDTAELANNEPHPTSRRKRDFASLEEMIVRFKTREPYALFDPRVFEDYCRFGLLHIGESFELACPPEVEASVYESSRSNASILETAASTETPALIIRAQQSQMMDFKGSPTWPELASTMPRGTDLYRPDRTHFHPLEDPADATKIIAEAIDGHA